MNISEFFGQFKNHPVLFVGTGFSLRYLKESYTWDGLLKQVCKDLWGSDEKYLDIRNHHYSDGEYQYEDIASVVENEFNTALENDRAGKFKGINDTYYEHSRVGGTPLSRFKIYIAQLLQLTNLNDDKKLELDALKKASKNISTIITTNYDHLLENVFDDFKPLIGNNILFNDEYGKIYKIHGCVDDVSKLIITKEDYTNFDKDYELVQAQLLFLFIHHPIIFLGYSISDKNIKKALNSIYKYIKINSEEAKKIRNNFLLVEYEKGLNNLEITDHEISSDGRTLTIKKIKTDNYSAIYDAIADLKLPVSVMDVRKVESVFKDIRSGGTIKVVIAKGLDDLKNSDKVIAIGNAQTMRINIFMTLQELIQDYFRIIDEKISDVISSIDKQIINNDQYFPVFGFSSINGNIEKLTQLKKQQKEKIENYINKCKGRCEKFTKHRKIETIMSDNRIAKSYKNQAIMYGVHVGYIQLDSLETYLKNYSKRKDTTYKMLLCLYDLKKYGD